MAETGRSGKDHIRRSKQTQKHGKKEEEKQQAHHHQKQQQEPESPSSRRALRGLFSCRHDHAVEGNRRKCKKIGCSGSICKLRDMQRPEPAPPEPGKRRASVSDCNATAERSKKKPLSEINGVVSNSFSSHSTVNSAAASSSSSSLGGSFRGMQLRRLSGCYECHTAVDPINGAVSREPSLRATVCPCPECGEIFVKAESLELHQAVRHAVSELGPEDSSRNIVEIIFLSSWLKKRTPACKIDRILKVHNTQKTITRFEDYRDAVKSKAGKLAKKHPRCTADGNELLRFYCTTFVCTLGSNGARSLCNSIPQCNLCSIIKDGFKTDAQGRIRTMATSGRAHDAAHVVASENERSAMLVCRVIAGRVKRSQDAPEECDSVAGTAGAYTNLDELFVFGSKAILPCFVVIYRG